MVKVARAAPVFVLVPITLLMFGFGVRMEIASVSFGCIPPVLIFTRGAAAGVEPGLRR